MVAPIAKTKTSEAINLLSEMDGLQGSIALDFKQRQFRRNYESAEFVDPDGFYFCKAIDLGLNGDLQGVIKNLSFIDYLNAPMEISMNAITLCRKLGLFFKVKEIAEFALAYEHALTSRQTRLLAETFAILGDITNAEKMIDRINKLYPEEAINLLDTAVCHLYEIQKRNIKQDDMENYWKQFENIVSMSAVKPKLFKRTAKIFLLKEDGSNQLVIDFREHRASICEDEIYDTSDAIAEGLSLIESPNNILTFVVSDISESSEEDNN